MRIYAQVMAVSCSTILVVEDDADIREVMIGILESEGYAVRTANDGSEALSQLREDSKPCVILLDLMMPNMDGWTFSDEREKDPELTKIPLVVLSAVPKHDPRNARMRAAEYLPKPVNVGKLLATVERFC